MRAKILHKSDIAEQMNNHFCSLGSKLNWLLVIPDTVFQPEDFLNRTDSNFHPDPLIRGRGGGGWSPKKTFRPFGPQFDYCDAIRGDCSIIRADKLQKLQNSAARLITWADYILSDHQMY